MNILYNVSKKKTNLLSTYFNNSNIPEETIRMNDFNQSISFLKISCI